MSGEGGEGCEWDGVRVVDKWPWGEGGGWEWWVWWVSGEGGEGCKWGGCEWWVSGEGCEWDGMRVVDKWPWGGCEGVVSVVGV